jgi:hypothetical protein
LSPWTRPEELTEATVGSELVHAMPAPVMGFPFLSSTVAVYCWVRPTASMVTAPGDTTIRDGTGAEVESPQDPKMGTRRRSPGIRCRDFMVETLAPSG